ncbi:hypothetical protein GOV12_03665 [Candidatus Pacearchaeota archaeon]|nr:hypothetical protein [Candidatus Pacearchaeota archaeon]
MDSDHRFGINVRQLLEYEKHILSSRRGYDIGVFGVVDHIISKYHHLQNHPSDEFFGMDKYLAMFIDGRGIATREEIAQDYLFSDEEDWPELNLFGDLRRFAVQRSNGRVNIEDVVLDEDLISKYIFAYEICPILAGRIRAAVLQTKTDLPTETKSTL